MPKIIPFPLRNSKQFANDLLDEKETVNSLKISQEITPELYECLRTTCENIYLDIILRR